MGEMSSVWRILRCSNIPILKFEGEATIKDNPYYKEELLFTSIAFLDIAEESGGRCTLLREDGDDLYVEANEGKCTVSFCIMFLSYKKLEECIKKFSGEMFL